MSYNVETWKKNRIVMGIQTLVADIPSELKNLVVQAAIDSGLSINEYVAKVLASKVRRPDLAAIPRKRPGRKPKIAS